MTRRRAAGKKKAVTRAARRAAPGKPRAARTATPRRGGALLARDLMTREPVTVGGETPIDELCDLLQANNINGAPVVDGQGRLLGVVTQEDIIFGAMGAPAGQAPAGRTPAAKPPADEPRRGGKRVMKMLRERVIAPVPSPAPAPGEVPFWADARRPAGGREIRVRDIMTSPAISADENTPVADLCRIMWNLRIHRVPILKRGKVSGLVSSMDLCRAILTGKISV
jgi:CBS domain-containing protein